MRVEGRPTCHPQLRVIEGDSQKKPSPSEEFRLGPFCTYTKADVAAFLVDPDQFDPLRQRILAALVRVIQRKDQKGDK